MTHPEPRDVGEERLRALGVVLGGVDPAAVRGAQHQGAGEAPAGAVAQARGMVQELVEGRVDEAHELDLGDRPEPLGGHTDGHAGDEGLRERRIEHPLGPEALREPRGGAEHAAVHAHVFA